MARRFASALFGDAGAGVAHAHLDPFAVAAGADGDRAFRCFRVAEGVGDGVGGVDDEVEQRLVEFGGEERDGGEIGVEFGDDVRDVTPLAAADGERAFDGFAEIDGALFAGPGMGEGFHRANDFRGAGDALEGVLDGFGNFAAEVIGAGGVVRGAGGADEVGRSGAGFGGGEERAVGLEQRVKVGEGLLEKAGVVPDELHGRVDLVGNAGGELADGFEFLGLAELHLELAAFGDIAGHEERALGGAEAGAKRAGVGIHGEPRAVLVLHAEFRGELEVTLEAVAKRRGDGGAVVGVNQLEDEAGGEFLGGVAEDAFEGRAAVEPAAGVVDDGDEVAGVFGDEPVAVFAAAELFGAAADDFFELVEMMTHLAGELPFFGERGDELERFDIVERFLEDEEPVGEAEFLKHLVARVIGVGGADDDLEIGIDGPDAGGGLDAVPAGRHANVHEHHGVGTVLLEGTADEHDGFLALESGIELEVGQGGQRLAGRAEEGGLVVGERTIAGFAAEDFSEVVVDGRAVIDDEDAVGGFRRFHERDAGAARGSSSVNVAPWPGPSLCARSEPPSSPATRAPLCRPKPWPFLRVVKPWAKMRVRFSGGMPTPLSATTMRARSASAAMRMVRRLSERPDSSQAYFALRMRLTRIWRTLCRSVVTTGSAW